MQNLFTLTGLVKHNSKQQQQLIMLETKIDSPTIQIQKPMGMGIRKPKNINPKKITIYHQ